MTSWADRAIAELKEGKRTTVKPHGNSMRPRIESGQMVQLEPREPKVGDVVLCKVHGAVYLHIIKAEKTNKYGHYFQIGNNKGHINGWTNRDSIYGVAIL